MDYLQARWKYFCLEAKIEKHIDTVFENILSAYTQPHRYYHNTQHLIDCLTKFEYYKHLFECPIVYELAFWFHDLIYEVESNTNEKDSAILAEEYMLMMGLDEMSIEIVTSAIIVTATQLPVRNKSYALLLDIDNSILGSPWPVYQQYANNIKREFCSSKNINLARFIQGREEFLQGVSRKKNIFNTVLFQKLYQGQAKQNIQSELSSLRYVDYL